VLFEARDFCSGASANSLKTVHSGIRYLQTLDFRRVIASSRECAILSRIAPHLISPLPCVAPIRPGLLRNGLSMRAALRVYDGLRKSAGGDSSLRSRLLSGAALAELVGPAAGGTGGIAWFDAQVYDTERFALSLIASAHRHGADAFNYMAVERCTVAGGRVTGVQLRDDRSGKSLEVGAAVVVDCTGQRAAENELLAPCLGDREFVHAYNLVVARSWLDVAAGVPMPSDPGRLMFVAPWRQAMLVGTWYRRQESDFELQEAAAAALDEVNEAFPDAGLSLQDVRLVHHGLLSALPSRDGELRLHEKNRIVVAGDEGGPHGLFAIQGVKYTTARNAAVAALDLVVRQLNRGGASVSHGLSLVGGKSDDPATSESALRASLGGALPETAISHLLRTRGGAAAEWASAVGPAVRELVPGSSEVTVAEVEWTLEHEQVRTLADLMLRRTGLGTFGLPRHETLLYCASLMSNRFGWTPEQMATNIRDLSDCYPAWTVREHNTTGHAGQENEA
jgi:glycerol-3-phosphate dehydrogenase